MTRFWNNLHHASQYIESQIILKSLGARKGHKENSHNGLMSPMSDGEYISLDNNYINRTATMD